MTPETLPQTPTKPTNEKGIAYSRDAILYGAARVLRDSVAEIDRHEFAGDSHDFALDLQAKMILVAFAIECAGADIPPVE